MSDTKFDNELFERGVRRVNPFKNRDDNSIEMTIERFDPCDQYGSEGMIVKLARKNEGEVLSEVRLNYTELSYIAREIDYFQEYGFKSNELDQKFAENCDCLEVQARNCIHDDSLN